MNDEIVNLLRSAYRAGWDAAAWWTDSSEIDARVVEDGFKAWIDGVPE